MLAEAFCERAARHEERRDQREGEGADGPRRVPPERAARGEGHLGHGVAAPLLSGTVQ